MDKPFGFHKKRSTLHCGTRRDRTGKYYSPNLSRRLRMESLEDRYLLATITVTTSADERNGPSVNGVSLREAIMDVAAASGDTIVFDPALNGAAVVLDKVSLGQIAFEKSLTIDASMLPNGLTLDGGDTSPQPGDGIRILSITDPTFGTAPPLVTLVGLTFTRGDAPFCGGEQSVVAGALGPGPPGFV